MNMSRLPTHLVELPSLWAPNCLVQGRHVKSSRSWTAIRRRHVSYSSERASTEEPSGSVIRKVEIDDGVSLIRSIPGLQITKHNSMPRRQNITKPRFMPQRQITYQCKVPAQFTKRHLMSLMSQMKLTTKQWEYWKVSGRQALVFLFTPSFATFVDNDPTLIPQILRKFSRMETWTASDALEIDVVTACIDGLAPSPEMFRVARRVKADEGFSILHGSLGGTLSPLWDGEQEEFSASPTLQSSITFRKGLKGPPDVTMPLANTLFKVGRRSMLSASRWKWDEAVKDFKAIKGPVERSNVRVNVFSNLGTRVPLSNIPVVPLTPARKIVHGLGNIVRSVEFDDDVVGPASQELEASVTEYLKEKGRSGETVDVWALVVPKEAVSNPDLDPEKQLIQRAYQVRQMWRTNLAEEEVDYVGRWIEQGATFCRVLSGGGGWGAKQGLLSLDPQLSYSEIPEARFDFSGGTLEEQQASALGTIAQEGSYIQFFVAQVARPHTTVVTPHESEFVAPLWRTTVFGAVPSTIDDIISESKFSSAASKIIFDGVGSVGKFMYSRRGHFGCVSESGMFLRHEPSNSRHSDAPKSELESKSTKIDLPHSYLYTEHRKKAPTPPDPRKIKAFAVSRKTPLEGDSGTLVRQLGSSRPGDKLELEQDQSENRKMAQAEWIKTFKKY